MILLSYCRSSEAFNLALSRDTSQRCAKESQLATKNPTKMVVAKQGNVFEFYVPLATPGTLTAAPKPQPTAVTPPGGGKQKYTKPHKFIKSNFGVATQAPFGTQANLPDKHHVVSDLDVVRAALECGYGRRSKWTAALALSPHEATGLANYLLLRLQMVASCLEFDGTQAKIPR